MPREDFTCSHRLRVRWSEVDMQKIVFNGNYLNYIDVAVTADLVYVNADPAPMVTAPLPAAVHDLVQHFERVAPQ
jgi:acyl-CoA thioesterase FadM